MDLFFDKSLITEYHSGSQIARVLTENWLKKICSVLDVAIVISIILKTIVL